MCDTCACVLVWEQAAQLRASELAGRIAQQEEEQLTARTELERTERKLKEMEKRVDDQKEVTRKQHNEARALL